MTNEIYLKRLFVLHSNWSNTWLNCFGGGWVMNIELQNGRVLSSRQSWDSGTFKSFQLTIGDSDSYHSYPLNWSFTKDQLKEIEAVMLAKAYALLTEGS